MDEQQPEYGSRVEQEFTPEPAFEGHPARDCGEHRTTGQRAWCFACSEWCYPEQPCKGCERPMLRQELAGLARMVGGLSEIVFPHLYALLYEDDPMPPGTPPEKAREALRRGDDGAY